jgi:hypothetical protein
MKKIFTLLFLLSFIFLSMGFVKGENSECVENSIGGECKIYLNDYLDIQGERFGYKVYLEDSSASFYGERLITQVFDFDGENPLEGYDPKFDKGYSNITIYENQKKIAELFFLEKTDEYISFGYLDETELDRLQEEEQIRLAEEEKRLKEEEKQKQEEELQRQLDEENNLAEDNYFGDGTYFFDERYPPASGSLKKGDVIVLDNGYKVYFGGISYAGVVGQVIFYEFKLLSPDNEVLGEEYFKFGGAGDVEKTYFLSDLENVSRVKLDFFRNNEVKEGIIYPKMEITLFSLDEKGNLFETKENNNSVDSGESKGFFRRIGNWFKCLFSRKC